MRSSRAADNTHVLPENHKSSLNREFEMLEKTVSDELGKLKMTVNAHEAAVLERSRHSEQLSNNFKADVANLEAKLKQTEETIAKKDSALQELEKNLAAEIKSLQNRLNAKDESITKKEKEISEYNSKVDNSAKQIGELQLVIRKANEEKAGQAKAADAIAKSSYAKITELESLVKKAQEDAAEKASTIEELTADVEELEKLANDKQELLIRQDAEITDLKAQLKRLTIGIGEMSSFFRETAAFTGISLEPPASIAAEHEPTSENSTRPAESNVPDTVPPDILQVIVSELAEFTNVMENLASLLVRRHAKSLGESIEKFPMKRLPELLEVLATEISDEDRRIDFRQQFAQRLHIALH